MRGLLALTLCCALLLSGCMGGSDDTSTSGSGTGSATSSPGTTGAGTGGGATGGPGTPGDATHFSCTAQAGLPGGVGQIGGSLGGCDFNAKAGIKTNGTVAALTPAGGCTVWFDDNPADDPNVSGNAAADTEYPKGTRFGVFCDHTMAPGAESTMDFTTKVT